MFLILKLIIKLITVILMLTAHSIRLLYQIEISIVEYFCKLVFNVKINE